MNKRSIHIVFAIALTAMLALCTCGKRDREYEAELSRAEALTDSLPDTALAITGRIPLESIRSPRLRALHTLVKTEARYKLYIDSPDDSLLSLAAAEFRSLNDRPRLMRTLFQLSLCKYYLVKYTEAMTPALESRDIAIELGNDEYIARASNQAAIVLHNNCSFTHALELTNDAIRHFRLAGMPRHERFAAVARGQVYSNMRSDSNALRILDSLSTLPDIREDSTFIEYVYTSKIDPLLSLGRNKEAADVVDSMVKYATPRFGPDIRYVAAVELANGNTERAAPLLDSIISTQSDWQRDARVLEVLSSYLSMTGRPDSAFTVARQLADLELLGIRRLMTQNLDKICGDYSTAVQAKAARKQFNYSLSIAIALLSVICVLSITFFRHRRKMKKRLKEKCDSLARAKEICTSNSQRIWTTFNNRIATLNGICDQYYSERRSDDTIRKMIYRNTLRELQRFKTEENLNEIELIINQHMDGIASKFGPVIAADPKLRPMILFILAGLKPSAISMLCDISRSNVYTQKSRIKAVISKMDIPEKAVLINALETQPDDANKSQ